MLKSPVTVAICILCTLVFVMEIAVGGNVFNCSSEILLNLGASTAPLTIGQGQYGRLISCIFLHAYLLHLILNLYVLVDFGPMAEISLGRRLYFFIFIFSGIMGALASIWYNPTLTSVGASAAVLGLLGALIYKSWFEKEGARFTRPQIIMLCIFLLYSLLLGFTSDVVDNAAHLGGFFSGMLACAAYFGTKPAALPPAKRVLPATAFLLALIPGLICVDITRVKNNPDMAIFKYRREALELMKNKEFAKGLEKLNEAQKECGDKVTSVLFDRAMAEEKLEHYDQALKDIELWLGKEKNDVQAILLKGSILHDLGRNPEALETINRALEVKPATLMDYFAGAVKGNTGQALIYNNRAWFELGMGRIKEGLMDSDKALSIDQRLASAHDTRGMAYFLLKDYTQAEHDFSRSIALNASDVKKRKGATEDGGGYYHRSLARQALGDIKGAKEDMDRFKTLDYKPEPWEPKP